MDSSSHHQHQQSQQQQLGGGAGNSYNDNLNQLSSLLQGTHQQPNPADVLSASAAGANMALQACRFCQQKFYVTSERLLEHELSCPMHLQLQQFLQQQNMQQQGQGLQQQLALQQNQLQAQFNKIQQAPAQQQTQQGQGLDSYNHLSNVYSNSLGQYGNAAAGMYQSNDPQAQAQSQIQRLKGLLQQTQQSPALEQQQQQAQYSSQASAHQAHVPPAHQTSNVASNEDQFESAIANLPAFEPKPLESSAPDSSTDYFPLAMPEDDEWLTPLHCFVRQYCVEVFVATPEDVAAPCMGKRNPVSVNQVGIRCPYCSPERMGGGNEQVDVTRARENGVVYPSLIGRIYNSSINLLQRHLRSCAFVPREILSRYEELKSSNARSGASKKYWADSATRLGLVDTPDGIRLNKEAHGAHCQAQQEAAEGKKNKASTNKSQAESEAPPLVLPSDKRNTTAFTFHLMSQMQPCVFTEADRLGRRRGLNVGFAGLACRHCFGVYGSGRFFPSSVKTMADASKTLDVIYRHVMKCKNCPCDIKGGLRNLRDFHDSERSKMPFGNQRAFFVKIWGRLHESGDNLVQVPRPMRAPSMASSTAAASTSVLPSIDLTKPQPADSIHGLFASTAAASSNSVLPSIDLTKPPHAADSIHGLYAMVKRGSSETQEQNKLVTEAA